MTPTEKQKCIAEQSVYGDFKLNYFGKIITAKGYDIAYNVYGILYWDQKDKKEIAFECDCNLILRPISDITKEITHKGYNNNQPFIPLVELAKEAQNATKTEHFKLVNDTVVDFTIAYHFKQNVMWFQSLQGKKQVYILSNQNRFFDLLHLWHFDTRNLIESDEAISTEVINPYKL